MMKLIRLAIYVSFLNFLFINPISAAEVVGTPTKYEVTMKKVELCTSSACTTTTVLAEKDGTFDIASASAGADVGSWITGYALEIGTTYTHIKATINSTFTIRGYVTDDDSNGLSEDYCATAASPLTASSGTSPAVVAETSATTNADMSYVVPNYLDDDNGDFYGTTTKNTFDSNNLTKVNDAATFTWIGALSSSYTTTASSAPKITISFDVTNQLGAAGINVSGNWQCGMYVMPPTVSVTLTD